MRPYRVSFERSHGKYNTRYEMDVIAQNAKQACEMVLEKVYTFGYNYRGVWVKTGFYPYHRKARRIGPEEFNPQLRRYID